MSQCTIATVTPCCWNLIASNKACGISTFESKSLDGPRPDAAGVATFLRAAVVS